MDARVFRHTTAAGFLGAAGPWLLRAEAEHNLILGLAAQLQAGDARFSGAPYLAVVVVDGVVAGCALRTPPHKLIITRMPDAAIPALVADVAACTAQLPAVLGPVSTAREFGRCWSAAYGVSVREGMRQRLYVLRAVRPPARRAPGSLQIATTAELPLIESWIEGFVAEAAMPRLDARRHAVPRVTAGDMALWYDGRPRSMAGVSGRSPHGVRIGYVYTPPAERGHGYASACVAALSQRMFDDGASFCCLFTDVSNAVSNGIYQQIGYEEECDFVDMDFGTRS
jgi:uncharacterized protein